MVEGTVAVVAVAAIIAGIVNTAAVVVVSVAGFGFVDTQHAQKVCWLFVDRPSQSVLCLLLGLLLVLLVAGVGRSVGWKALWKWP